MCDKGKYVLAVVIIYVFLRNCCENEMNGLRGDIDVYGIKIQLHTDVFGQPLVHTILPKVIKEYNKRPESGPLILSFHGYPGTGKNFVSNILAQNFFVRGQESKYFHMFTATKDFPATNSQQQMRNYKDNLRFRLYFTCNPKVDGDLYCLLQSFYELIFPLFFAKENNICRRLYVFDEVDSLPGNLLYTVSSFMRSSFFNKTIVVFLSNVGGQEIFEEIETHEMNNFTKDQIDHNKLVKVVQDAMVNSPPKYNPSMVYHIVPFLPLERDHVAMCIRTEITQRIPLVGERVLIKLTENVLKELLFHGFQDKYATKGCKNVVEKVNLILAREEL